MAARVKRSVAIFVLVLLAAGAVGLWLYVRNNQAASFARQITALGNGGTPQNIDDLKKAILLYQKDVDRLVKEQATTGTYYRILASRYQDKGMHKEALDALQKALEYNPADATLLYMTGVSASYVANGSLDFASAPGAKYDASSIRSHYYAMAEDAFSQAISIDPSFSRPYYGLALLYTFYMNRPADAIPLLKKYNTIVKNDVDAYSVLGRAYYMTGQYQEAISTYDTLLGLPLSKDQKAQVTANKQQAWNKLYG
jgi:tetratricopeptide (TPR) repeat protein